MSVPGAAITGHHKLRGLKRQRYCVIVPEARKSETEVAQGHTSSAT